ncbi:amp dependent CoA ligase [Laetiporus sulphureus 93-53]|uniref:Amp dependent CoA ligase n=1 Tax=Laetiporus sulphureus 93-53 TaxID=1314785 RepID=A0A165AZK9_9APHY|nr:amp dependent CoA ligase [Laetiporus sulphureus 93-53]KZS99949.1 amp dependent CoA ligase [Laetiporus sulphureus 93-53]
MSNPVREIQGVGGPMPAIPDDLTIVQFMLDRANEHPSRPDVARREEHPWMIENGTGRKVFVKELRYRTNALANALRRRWNVVEDDVVCLFSPNHVDYPVMVWAVHRLGAIVTTANPAYTASELVHQLKITNARLILVHSAHYAVALEAARTVGIPEANIILVEGSTGKAATVPELIEEGARAPKAYEERRLAPGEAKTKLAFLNFSSGTTGLPKAVMIQHYALVANVLQIAAYANADTKPWERRTFRSGDVFLAVLPFYHAYGLAYIMHFGFFYGMPLVVVPKFNFVDMLRSIERHRINMLPTVPPIVVLFCKHPDVKKYDLSSVRVIMCGAAPLSGELSDQLAAEVFQDVQIGQGFGMTETFTIVALPRHDQVIGTPGSAGVLIPGITARVVRPDGSDCAPDEPGQFVLTGPAMALGYWNNEQATKETFVDGWVYTGDEVTINDRAELFVVDRIKELLKVRGFQVAPAELEGFLLTHPDVSDACVVGLPDDYHGDLPLAFVVPSVSALERIKKDPAEGERVKAALIKYVADGKVYYKQLSAGVEFTDVIPRNPSGKLLRRYLRDKAKELRGVGQKAKAKAKL